ncbi:hypothetical protein Tco_1253380 [Tanacetum coccineum]
MENENPIRTLRDYSRPSHEGYRNTIELPDGNNVVPLRSDTIQLVQNGCSFYRLWSEDPNQHLKDFLKLVDSLDLDVTNRERTPAGGKLRDKNAKESWALLEDLSLYDNESWNDPRDFTKPLKAISLPQDVPMNKITSSCEICSGPHDTQYFMENPEQAFVQYAFSRNNEVGGDSMARVNTVSVYHPESDAPLRKGIKSSSKLLSPKYQSQSSPGEQNKSSSSPKHVYFVNTITVIRKDDEFREAGTIESDAAKDNGRDITVEGEKETEEGLDSSKPVIKEDESQDIKQNDPDDRSVEKQRSSKTKKAGQDVVKEPAKRQRTEEALGLVQEQTGEEPKVEELSQEQLHQMIMVIPVEEVYVEALQKFDRDDLDKLWNLVKERFRTTEPTEDKARELWVELKRLFEPDDNDTLWKLQRYMHDPLKWWLYDTCGVHHVSTERGHDIYMLVKKDYPLTKALATLMLCNKLRVDQYSDMVDELLQKINIIANMPSQRGLLEINLHKLLLLVQELSTAQDITNSTNQLVLPEDKVMEFESAQSNTTAKLPILKLVKANMEKAREVKKESVPRDLPIVNPYVPPVPFLRRLKEQEDDPYITHEEDS